MKSELHVIANASHARIVQPQSGRLFVLEQLEHPGSQRHFAQRGGGVAKDSLQFACEITHRVEQLARQGRVSSLHLYAPEPLLGELEQSLGNVARHLLADSHPVDLSRVGPAELERRMREQVAQTH